MNNDVLVLIYSAQDGTTPPESIIKFVQEMQGLGFQTQVSNQGVSALRYVLVRNTEAS